MNTLGVVSERGCLRVGVFGFTDHIVRVRRSVDSGPQAAACGQTARGQLHPLLICSECLTCGRGIASLAYSVSCAIAIRASSQPRETLEHSQLLQTLDHFVGRNDMRLESPLNLMGVAMQWLIDLTDAFTIQFSMIK